MVKKDGVVVQVPDISFKRNEAVVQAMEEFERDVIPRLKELETLRPAHVALQWAHQNLQKEHLLLQSRQREREEALRRDLEASRRRAEETASQLEETQRALRFLRESSQDQSRQPQASQPESGRPAGRGPRQDEGLAQRRYDEAKRELMARLQLALPGSRVMQPVTASLAPPRVRAFPLAVPSSVALVSASRPTVQSPAFFASAAPRRSVSVSMSLPLAPQEGGRNPQVAVTTQLESGLRVGVSVSVMLRNRAEEKERENREAANLALREAIVVHNSLRGVMKALDDGADVNAVVRSETALCAAFHLYEADSDLAGPIIETLVLAGARLDQNNIDGQTPLAWAYAHQDSWLSGFLSRNGACLFAERPRSSSAGLFDRSQQNALAGLDTGPDHPEVRSAGQLPVARVL